MPFCRLTCQTDAAYTVATTPKKAKPRIALTDTVLAPAAKSSGPPAFGRPKEVVGQASALYAPLCRHTVGRP